MLLDAARGWLRDGWLRCPHALDADVAHTALFHPTHRTTEIAPSYGGGRRDKQGPI